MTQNPLWLDRDFYKKDLSTIILKVEVRALGKIRRIGVYEMAIYSRIDPRTY